MTDANEPSPENPSEWAKLINQVPLDGSPILTDVTISVALHSLYAACLFLLR